MFEAITVATFLSFTALTTFIVAITISTLWNICHSWNWKGIHS
jgi:hypothetical protein